MHMGSVEHAGKAVHGIFNNKDEYLGMHGTHILFWGQWYSCFGFLMMSHLGVKRDWAAVLALQRLT